MPQVMGESTEGSDKVSQEFHYRIGKESADLGAADFIFIITCLSHPGSQLLYLLPSLKQVSWLVLFYCNLK